MTAEMITFVLYFVALFGVALVFYFNGSNKNQEDFFLGGRSVGPWVAALSAQASDMSAWLLMGLPGSILAFGFGQIWIGIGLAIGTAANWIICAKRLRIFSESADDAITIPQYLANRFATDSKTLQFICALIFLFAYTVYVASAFVAGTTVFEQLFPGVSTSVIMIIFALVIVAYTFLGGFKAVCWTDFFQGLLMMIALMAVPIIVLLTQNPDPAALATVYEYTDASGAVVTCSFGSGIFSVSWQEVITGLGWGLGYFGMPHIIVRFMSITKPSQVKTSSIVAIVWVVISLGAACLVAYYGRMLVAEELLPYGLQKTVFIVMARKYFPTAISGLLLAAIIAAAISTADSQLLVASSSFTSDLYVPLFRKNASEKEILLVGRLVVFVLAFIAYLLASSRGSGAQAIMNMVENAWGAFGSAFGPTIILSLFWRKFNYKGAVAGVLVGFIVDVVWMITLTGSTGVYEIVPGFICSMIAAVVVTMATGGANEKETGVFDKAVEAGQHAE